MYTMDSNDNPAKGKRSFRSSFMESHRWRPSWGKKVTVVALIIVALLIVTALGAAVWRRTHSLVKTNQYQAVFLTNGQVYFGKVRPASDKYITLEDVYYLQTNNNNSNVQSNSQQNNLTLVKLGNELHGPEDMMYIARDQILFWENLKDSGKVVQAIKSGAAKSSSSSSTNSTSSGQ